MTTQAEQSKYQAAFDAYYRSFKGLDNNQERNFEIKKDHSYRVAELAESIATKAGLDDATQALAYPAGLFHDIGRFPQFIKYNTFNDSVSADHAALSLEVVQGGGFLSNLPAEKVEAVCSAIFLHNKAELGGNYSETTGMLAKVLRDADKLDILHVLSDYYEKKNAQPNHTLTWELPIGFKISDEVAAALSTGKTIPKAAIKNQLDLKVFQMSWVHDLNFKASFRLLSQGRFFDRIYATIPKSDKVIEYYRGLKIIIENRINSYE
jgi:putative nucleotidyltransferase with HDIG domain